MAVALSAAFLVAQAMSTSPAAAPAPSGEPAFTISAPGTIKGERQGSDRLVAHDIEVGCDGVLFNGGLERRSATLALSPEMYGCIADVLSGIPADYFTAYACDYVLHDVRPMGGAQWRTGVDIDCPGEFTGFAVELSETFGGSGLMCAIWLREQRDVGTATVRNLGGRRGGIEVRWDLQFEYELTTPDGSGSSLLCGSLPGSTGTDASYTGTATIFAEDRRGNPLKLWVAG